MAEGYFESKRLQLLYAKGDSTQSGLFYCSEGYTFSFAICHRSQGCFFVFGEY